MKYKVTKYAQSCFLIEKDGLHCLIDPGRFVVEQNSRKPQDWPKIDVILVTHEHPDHADVSTIKFLVERDGCPVYTNASFAKQLTDQGVRVNALKPGESIHAGGFHVRGVAQRHGVLSGGRPIPEDIGFIVDSTFYTPGDSINLPGMPQVPVLFVPVAGPDMNFETARAMIDVVKPKLAIPMHYANVQKYPIDVNELRAFHVPGTEVLVLEDKQFISWPKG